MKTKEFVLLLIISFFFGQSCFAQTYCTNPKFEKEVANYLSESVDLISCDELAFDFKNYLILDAREFEEYNISHLPGALFIGYNDFDFRRMNSIDKTENIVVYCSIGYRSEKIGEKLLKMGFNNVQNLYGSIFEWANQNRSLVDENEEPTNCIHGYSKKWSKWVKNEALIISY